MSVPLGLAALVVLVGANAFFVAAEFSLVAAYRPAIEERAALGSRRARAALHEMRNLSFMLSGAQLGITISSLVLGFVAEEALAGLLDPLLRFVDVPAGTTLGVSLAAALALSTLFQMIVGELAPKNLAIARPQGTALAVAVPARVYSLVFGPLIRLFDGAANQVTRLLGYEPRSELLAGYTPEELAAIFQASGEKGTLTAQQTELLLRAVEAGERQVSGVMVPRPDVLWLQADEPLETLREAARRTGFSRFPVYGSREDDLVGTVHIKDLLAVVGERTDLRVGDLADEVPVVPETNTLRRMLSDLRARRRTFAVVVDEYGSVAGIVTLEDILEELVGEIEDEFDVRTSAVRRLGAGRFVIPGRLHTDRLGEVAGLTVPAGEYETVAGFILARLGRIPTPGDEVRHDGWRLVVRTMEGNRVAEVVVVRPAEVTTEVSGEAVGDRAANGPTSGGAAGDTSGFRSGDGEEG